MSEKRRYIILRWSGAEQLEAAVNEAIANGYEPLGAPFLVPYAPGYGGVWQIPTTRHDDDRGEPLPWIEYDVCQAMRLVSIVEVAS